MSLMVLVVTGTPPKTANGAEAAIGVTAGRVVGSVAAKRRSASSKTAVDACVCAAMAVDNCPLPEDHFRRGDSKGQAHF
jgi:hypothetical protein